MSASNVNENGMMGLLFQNASYALVGDATGLRGSTTAGSFYITLHTADPGEAGTQSTSESAYTNYARVAVARTSGAWAVASGVASNISAITFAQCGVTGSTITYCGIGQSSSGATQLEMSGTASLTVSTNVTPSFAASALAVTMD